MAGRIISRNTLLVFGGLVLAVVVWAALIISGLGGETGAMIVADVAETLIVGIAAAVIITTALALGAKTPVGRPWLLIGLGAASYAVGDLIWTIMEVGMGMEVPYPGLPDLFYLIEYPLVAWALLSAGLAFRGLVPLRRPTVIALLVGAGLTVVTYVWLLAPSVLSAPDVSMGERVLSTFYPLADVLLMITPAVFVIAVVSALGGGRLAWPWWAVAAGAFLIALSDAGYSWLSTYDLYASGSFIDYGWGLGHVLMMLGALIVRDFAKPHAEASAAEAS